MINGEEIKTSKFLRVIEALIEILIKLGGVILTYNLFNFLGNYFFQGNFQADTLYSLLMLPTLYVLKEGHIIFSPPFVKVKISQTHIQSITGIFTQRIDNLNLKTAENIEVINTPLGRCFNYGTIMVYGYGSWVKLPFVVNPERIRLQLEDSQKNFKNK